MKQQPVKIAELQTLRLGINLFTPIFCGIVLVELCLQIVWNLFTQNGYINELLASALVGCLLYAAMQGITDSHSRSSIIVSGIFYFLAGILCFFIEGFNIILLNLTLSLKTWGIILIFFAVIFYIAE